MNGRSHKKLQMLFNQNQFGFHPASCVFVQEFSRLFSFRVFINIVNSLWTKPVWVIICFLILCALDLDLDRTDSGFAFCPVLASPVCVQLHPLWIIWIILLLLLVSWCHTSITSLIKYWASTTLHRGGRKFNTSRLIANSIRMVKWRNPVWGLFLRSRWTGIISQSSIIMWLSSTPWLRALKAPRRPRRIKLNRSTISF